jgi:hypothetical protein
MKIPSRCGSVLGENQQREDIEDFGEGVGEFLTQMRAFMDIKGRPDGKGCEELLDERRLAKGRLFNTIDNTRLTKKEHDAQAEAYRRARDGKDGIL